MNFVAARLGGEVLDGACHLAEFDVVVGGDEAVFLERVGHGHNRRASADAFGIVHAIQKAPVLLSALAVRAERIVGGALRAGYALAVVVHDDAGLQAGERGRIGAVHGEGLQSFRGDRAADFDLICLEQGGLPGHFDPLLNVADFEAEIEADDGADIHMNGVTYMPTWDGVSSTFVPK